MDKKKEKKEIVYIRQKTRVVKSGREVLLFPGKIDKPWKELIELARKDKENRVFAIVEE